MSKLQSAPESRDIDIVPEGWWALDDADTFYPDDLPDEWRLTYFANQFRAVLVPRLAWQGRAAFDFSGWRSDVHSAFRFFLECRPALDGESMQRAATAFGPALTAFVQGSNPGIPRETDQDQAIEPALETKPASRLLAPDAGHEVGLAIRCPRRLNADPRGARAWLNGLAEKPRLVILDRPTASDLEAWGNLVMLLGLVTGRSTSVQPTA